MDDLGRLAVSFTAAPLAVRDAVGASLRAEGQRVAADAQATVTRLTGATASGITVRGYRAYTEVDATDEASVYLEYGTSDTAPQPFMRPAGDRAEARIGGVTDAVVEAAIKGVLG